MLLLMALLGACAHLPAVGPIKPVEEAPETAVMGWRLVPGQELSYAYTVRLLRGNDEVGRTEHWTYLVKEVSEEGVALLEGRLTGFGAVLKEEDVLLSEAELLVAQRKEMERLQDVRVWLNLGMDGQLQGVDGLDWEDALIHHLLGLTFPSGAVKVGDQWSDPATISPYVELLPPEVAILPSSRQGLVAFRGERGGFFAVIESEGEVVAGDEDVPRIVLTGEAQWDLVSGALESRNVWLSLSQYDAPFGGQLLLETRRQH